MADPFTMAAALAAMFGGSMFNEAPSVRVEAPGERDRASAQAAKEAAAFKRNCPKCKALAGSECRNKRGRYRFHGARMK